MIIMISNPCEQNVMKAFIQYLSVLVILLGVQDKSTCASTRHSAYLEIGTSLKFIVIYIGIT